MNLRNTDLMRVVPAMTRLLPEEVIACAAQAIELNALSQELDLLLLARLPRADGFSVADYCRAYRQAGPSGARRRQIDLTCEVGGALDRYVHKRLVRATLAMMSKPARLSGLSALQDFLERGLASFRAIGGAEAFLAIIRARETSVHEAIAGGSNAPFPDPRFALATPRHRERHARG
jgi:hypothetical protein